MRRDRRRPSAPAAIQGAGHILHLITSDRLDRGSDLTPAHSPETRPPIARLLGPTLVPFSPLHYEPVKRISESAK